MDRESLQNKSPKAQDHSDEDIRRNWYSPFRGILLKYNFHTQADLLGFADTKD